MKFVSAEQSKKLTPLFTVLGVLVGTALFTPKLFAYAQLDVPTSEPAHSEYTSIEASIVHTQDTQIAPIKAADQISDQVTYTDDKLGYSFTYPKDWRAYSIPGMQYVRVENLDADGLSKENSNSYFKIEVVTLPNPDNLSLQEWVKNQNTTSEPLPNVQSQKDILIGGQPAIYQIESFGSLVHPVIFIQKGNNIYLLNISSTYEANQVIIQDFLENFTFNTYE